MRKNNISGAEKFLLISGGLMIFFGCLYFGWPPFARMLSDVSSYVQEYALAHGYWGGFFITLVSNAALIIPIPYGTVLFVLGGIGLNPWLLGLVAGLAAGLGEAISYAIGRGAGTMVSPEQQERFKKINVFISGHPRLIPWLIFLFGVTPIPDDIILLPLGMVKYPFWKTIIPDLAGKLVMVTTFSVAGKYSLASLTGTMGSEGGFWSGMIIVALTVLAIYLTIKIKWEKLIKL